MESCGAMTNGCQDSKHNGFEWSKAVETGHDQIDQEHKKLFELLSQLNRIVHGDDSSLVVDVVAELRLYTVNHFSNEEKLMDAHKYKAIRGHKRAHAEFVKKLDEINSASHQMVASTLAYIELIYDWLFSHICTFDKLFISSINGEDEGYQTNLSDSTVHIIDTSLEIARDLSKITVILTKITDENKKKAILEHIADMSVRIVNLVALLISRQDSGELSRYDLNRIKTLKMAVMYSAKNLINHYCLDIIRYGGKIIAGNSGFPIGSGPLIRRWLSEVETLIIIVSEQEIFSMIEVDQIIEAYDIYDEVSYIEEENIKLENFDRTRSPRNTRKYEVPDVIMALKSRQSSEVPSDLAPT
jgi:hemerythrin